MKEFIHCYRAMSYTTWHDVDLWYLSLSKQNNKLEQQTVTDRSDSLFVPY